MRQVKGYSVQCSFTQNNLFANMQNVSFFLWVLTFLVELILFLYSVKSRFFYRNTLAFYFPGILGVVTKFCKSCVVCLKSKPKWRTSKAFLQISSVFDRPFHKCAADLLDQ